jgi:hypothetical protein
MDLGERAEALARHVIGPLVLGGPLVPQRPFGAARAAEIGAERRIVDDELRTRVDLVRLRVARSIAPIDFLPELDGSEWALAAALNDLLQVTNHELSGFGTRRRHQTLLASVRGTIARVPPCRALGEAVARHATFARALELCRTDTRVAWWTGSADFRGQTPPPRLLAWPGLRNVRVDRNAVPLVEMARGTPTDEAVYQQALAEWLACSPLTDLANADRETPAFRWTSHSVSLVATLPGSNLALRTLSVGTDDDAVAGERALAALERATTVLPEGPARAIAAQFTAWLGAAREHWAEPA